MSAIEKVKAHYSGLPRRDLYVPEWELTIYWSAWSVAEKENFIEDIERKQKKKEMHARVLLFKAEDKDGKKLFQLEDLPILLRSPPAVLDRVALEIIRELTPEQAEKN